MDGTSPRKGAGHILSHFLPRKVLREAHDLALEFEREKIFQSYVLKHLWFVYLALLLFIIVSSACAAGVAMVLLSVLPPQWAKWILALVFLAVPIVWLGGVISQLYFLFSWLEKKALRQAASLALEAAVSTGYPRSNVWGRRRLWLAFTAFVVVPLGLLALYSTTVAMIVIASLILASVVLTMFQN